MADTVENSSVTVDEQQQQQEEEVAVAAASGGGEEGAKPPIMAEIDEQQQQQTTQPQLPPATKPPEKMLAHPSFSIWPPTQRTRDAVMNRLIETLSSPSILSKRYGTMSHDEAAEAARRIEEEAFGSASASASSDDDGVEILQVYSKEISQRMLDAVKSRSASGAVDASSVEQPPAHAGGEETSSVETES